MLQTHHAGAVPVSADGGKPGSAIRPSPFPCPEAALNVAAVVVKKLSVLLLLPFYMYTC